KGWSCRLKSEQTIRINLPRLARTFDPRTSVDRRSGVLMKMLYEGLICLDDKGRPIPGVAHTYEISPDGKTYTFHLRRCFWTNGEAVTADDFEYTWKKVLDPQFDSQFAYLLFAIRGAQQAKEGKLPISSVGIYAQGEQKLVVELDHITPYFLELCSHWVYLPLHRGIDKDRPGSTQTAGADLVCNGAFRITSAPLYGELKLVKNALYWDEEHVSLDRISILSIDDPYTAMTMFETGNLDWVGAPLCDLPTRAMPTFKRDRRLHSFPSTATFRVEFNVDSSPFSSKKVRQAFAAAIDRQRVIDEVLGCGELPAFQLLSPELTKEKTRTGDIFDPELAQTLLAEGLSELGLKELAPIVFNYPLLEDQGAVIEVIAKQWRQILGVNTVLEGVPWRSYNEHILSQPTQVVAMMWYTWIADPCYDFEGLRFSTGRFNASRWENPDFQQLMDQLDATLEENLRHELFLKLEQIILKEVPVTPIYFHRYRYLCNPKIQGAKVIPVGQMDFKTVYVDRKEP
ncbi:MAG: peptide ABC transporter substrate-binding protein, partial [Verrucomicrobia bacterium]|nr:peptide ABC transporter substrate-binding protein [Verrucomicrobiota bacterium]